MTHAEKLAEIARIGTYLSPSDPAATRGDLLLRNAGGAGRREADSQQAGSVCDPASGRRAPGARPGAFSFMRLLGLAICGVSAGGMLAALWLLASTVLGVALVLAPAWWVGIV